ncbi:MAG: UvrD-helicase domain-containing protein [Clostridia bacterium]|nr:UvrD-helicase domain-containing protein [Clostridia bacterium]
MRVKLTEQQRLAVTCRGGSLIVSAAAGAGKTAVLVQRVLGLLTDEKAPCGVDELLVVTFTNAAAGEMRQRIGDELRRRLAQKPDDHNLRRQLGLLGSARIQTVHAFCQSLLREHFTLCGIEPDFRLADETQCALLQEQALNDAMEEAYRAAHPAFLQLCDNLTDGRSDRVLTGAVLDIFGRMRSHPNPERLLDYLPRLCESAPEGREWMKALQNDAKSRLEHARAALEQTRALCQTVEEVEAKYGPMLEGYLAFAARLRQAMEAGWDEARACLDGFEKGRLPGCKYEDKAFLERVKAGRERFAQAMLSLRQECYFQPWAAIEAEGKACAPMVWALCELVGDFSDRYQQEKRRRGLLDFSDLEHLTLGLLLDEEGKPSDLAQTLRRQFKEVLVDEYQDTNEIQERIFKALRGEGDSAFFVGDVKQSIYRFRLAEPKIFLERYEKSNNFTGTETGDVKLSLNRNFRSRPEVLALCNAVFSRLMSRAFGDVDYDESQRLYAGRECQYTLPSEVLLLDCPPDPTKEEEEAKAVREARLVALRVARILKEERVPEGEGSRPARPEDVAILLSSFANKAPIFRSELQKLGIPCGAGGGAFFGTVETSVMLSLLRVLHNRRQDIPLISVLRSPLYLASPDLLARLRLQAPDGDLIDGVEQSDEPLCKRVLSDLDRWSGEVRALPLSRLIRLIYDETGAEGLFALLDNGAQRVRNLHRLEELARPFDGSGGGLSAFLRWIDRKLKEDDLPEEPGEETGGVCLLSIHRSKGLEWPFVIVPDLSKRFNTDDLKKPVMFHPYTGIGLRLRQQDTHAELRTQLQQAIILQTRQELRSEEVRKLYVAMTRAR